MGAEQSSPRRMGGEADENEADGSALVAGFDRFFRFYTDVEYLRSVAGMSTRQKSTDSSLVWGTQSCS